MIKKTSIIKLPDSLKLADGKSVPTGAYVKAKTKDLREFGYPKLEEATVREQLHFILAKKPLSVIGMFMVDEIEIPK